jgi:hypothetical protein
MTASTRDKALESLTVSDISPTISSKTFRQTGVPRREVVIAYGFISATPQSSRGVATYISRAADD